jgi:hypothetical protein
MDQQQAAAVRRQFTTGSIGMVAALRVHGIYPFGQGRDDANQTKWYYDRDGLTDDLIHDYRDGRLQVDARQLWEAIDAVQRADRRHRRQ